jgi:hypothetical protein
VGVEREPHFLWKRLQEKVLWQGIIEIIGNAGDNPVDPVLAFECFEPFPIDAALWLVRDEVEDRLAVARDDDGFAFLDETGERRQAILASLMDTVVMPEMQLPVATLASGWTFANSACSQNPLRRMAGCLQTSLAPFSPVAECVNCVL